MQLSPGDRLGVYEIVVHFTSFAAGSGSPQTVWCLDFSTAVPATCGSWPSFGVATSFGGNVDASPTLCVSSIRHL